VELVKANSTLLVYAGLNAKSPPLDKTEVREAIRYAINYDEIVNTLIAGNGKLVQELIPDGFFGHTGQNPFKQDLAKAKELIHKAGVAEGTEIEMLVPARGNAPGGVEWGTLAAKIQSDLMQIGLKINIKAYIVLYQPVLTYGVRKNVKGFVYDSIDTPSISCWLMSKS
jgi:peptide/nickel transport system substrate-binding protein